MEITLPQDKCRSGALRNSDCCLLTDIGRVSDCWSPGRMPQRSASGDGLGFIE
jgi:hypothetical protein